MRIEKRSKLNILMRNWPSQAVYVSSWLNENGISHDLLAKYRQSGWVKPIGNGAVAKSGDNVSWEGGLYAIQSQLKLPVHIGGKSALLLKGYGHFIPQGKNWFLTLVADPKTKLPAWFKNYKWDVRLHFFSSNLFKTKVGLSSHSTASFSLQISAPERAMMEVLTFVPKKESFSEAYLLMEGLTSLRPKIVEQLLQECRSIKGEKTFLFLAESCNHSWFKKIDFSKVDLGKGKRVIEKNGILDNKYEITIPRDMSAKENRQHE